MAFRGSCKSVFKGSLGQSLVAKETKQKPTMVSMFKRLVTTFIACPLIILVMFSPRKEIFLIFVLLGILLALREFSVLARRMEAPVYGRLLAALAVFYVISLYAHLELAAPLVNLLTLCAERQLFFSSLGYLSENLLLPVVLMLIFSRGLIGGLESGPLRRVVMTSFAFVYIVILAAFMLRLRCLPQGSFYVLYLFVITWIGDAGGYYVGGYLGRHGLTSISPKKTWEGVLGSLAFGLGIAHLLHYFLPMAGFGGWELSLLVLLLTFGDICGDLFESVIKRTAGVKDSGGSIPGHGGILDKMDALFFNAPLFYIYLVLVIL